MSLLLASLCYHTKRHVKYQIRKKSFEELAKKKTTQPLVEEENKRLYENFGGNFGDQKAPN